MFNKATFLFSALVACSVSAGRRQWDPRVQFVANDLFRQNAEDIATFDKVVAALADANTAAAVGKVQDGLESGIDLELSAASATSGGVDETPAPAVTKPVVAATMKALAVCDKMLISDNITELKEVAGEIVAVNFPFNDPMRKTSLDKAIDALDAAEQAAAADDFAAVSTQITLVSDTANSLVSGKIQDGVESGIDLNFFTLARDGSCVLKSLMKVLELVTSFRAIVGGSRNSISIARKT
ncbi:hypothetical protein C8R43DRAFT_946064 [Mycena crocata]|nr:hypothetical protein C8R43DRAFT_946064 [Mycena crocata]